MQVQIAEIYMRNRRDHRLAVQIESRLPREFGSESDAASEGSRRGGVRAKGIYARDMTVGDGSRRFLT